MTLRDLPIGEPTIMPAPTITATTGTWDGTDISNRISTEAHQALDAKLAAWFGNTTELAAYDADAVQDLGRHTI